MYLRILNSKYWFCWKTGLKGKGKISEFFSCLNQLAGFPLY